MFVFLTFILLFGAWVILSGRFDLFHLSLGGISSLLVALLSADLLFQDRQKGFSARAGEALRLFRYILWLLYQIVLANLHVLALAVSPKHMRQELDPHIFTFKTILKGEFARFVLANSITLTPGTVTIRVHEGTFYVHAISRKAAGDFIEAEAGSEMERRIAWIFEGGQR